MNLILFGAPGAGKGTQAVEIVKKYNLVHISTGEMFRQAMAEQTPMGVKAAKYITQGLLVPDDVTVGIVKERLSKDDVKNGFILDGFPRTINQADKLKEILHELNISLDYVVSIHVSEDELLKRLTGRRMCKKCGASYHLISKPSKKENVCDECGGELYVRKDDNTESVQVRLNAYKGQTYPLIAYYKKDGIYVEINGEQAIDKVFNDIVAELGVSSK